MGFPRCFAIGQRREESANSYRQFKRQFLSFLTLISDSEFQEGQAAIERAADREHTPMPVIEIIELLVFRGDPIAPTAA